jgi:hypothetical protein
LSQKNKTTVITCPNYSIDGEVENKINICSNKIVIIGMFSKYDWSNLAQGNREFSARGSPGTQHFHNIILKLNGAIKK